MSAARSMRAALDSLTDVMAIVSGGLFLLLSLYITLNVVARSALGASVPGMEELSGYILAAGGLLAQGHALKSGAHIRMDVLFHYFPARLQAALDVGAFVLMVLFAGVLATYSWRNTLESLEGGTRSVGLLQTPLYIPQAVIAFGLTLLLVQAVLLTIGYVFRAPGTFRPRQDPSTAIDDGAVALERLPPAP